MYSIYEQEYPPANNYEQYLLIIIDLHVIMSDFNVQLSSDHDGNRH